MLLPKNNSPQKIPREHHSNPRSLEVVARFVQGCFSRPTSTTTQDEPCGGICTYNGACPMLCDHGKISLRRGETYTCPYFIDIQGISYKE